MEIGDIVQIQDDNEWKGLYGIVQYMYENTAYIFCVQNPCYLYKTTKENNIKLIENNVKKQV